MLVKVKELVITKLIQVLLIVAKCSNPNIKIANPLMHYKWSTVTINKFKYHINNMGKLNYIEKSNQIEKTNQIKKFNQIDKFSLEILVWI
jgi:hypothetical protein